MVIKLGINGFGRIGRVIFRTCFGRSDIEVVAINDPAIDVEYICYLIKFDSTHGRFTGTVSFCKNEISVDGQNIKVYHEKLPANIPWFNVSVQYVIEASGMFTNYEKASGHLKSEGVKRVIVTAPSADVPMLIAGVNEDSIGIDQKVISCASSTLYCLAPIVKILEDEFGVSEGFVTSIHAMTPSLKPLDGLCLRGKHWRDHRSIHQNIIPAATGACKALNKIIPQVKDKMSGLAFRVPIVNVSVLDMSMRLNMETSLQEIIKCVQKHSDTNMKNIITISTEESVSSDFLEEEHSCILDATSSLQLTPNFYKLVCWYENERSYACRVIDVIHFSERQYIAHSLWRLKNTQSTSSRGTETESTKSMFAPRHYRFEVYPNMICSASQDTGFRMKLPLHPPFTKNTRNSPPNETTLTRVINKTNEICKVWNDVEVNKNPMRQNPSSFFQSCMASVPRRAELNKYVQNREHLQRVKDEFSKMVHMTEDLLKKSSHSTNRIDETIEPIPEKGLMDSCDIEKNTFPNMGEKKSKILDKVPENNPMGGDYNEDISVKYAFDHNDETGAYHNRNKVNILKPAKAGDFFEKPSFDNILPHSPVSQSLCSTPDVCKKIAGQKKQDVSPSLDNTTEKDNEPINRMVYKKEDNTISSPTIGQYETKIEDTTYNQLRNNSKEHAEIANNVKNNIVLESSPESNLNKTFTKEERDYNENCNKSSDIPYITVANNLQTKQKTLESFLRKYTMSRVDLIPEKPSSCGEDSLRTATNNEDIYDKLDSASATDSENSFDEKKSQIIDITDLTNSIEDLVRLDKICRIIEISDELSDKLFSALTCSHSGDIKTKTWSFKDLCERLNLDEFCNKLFGQ